MSGFSNNDQRGRQDDLCDDAESRRANRNFMNTIRTWLKYAPALFLSVVCLILVVMLSLIIQTESNLGLLKKFYSNLLVFSNSTGQKLDIIENLLLKMGIDCGVDDLDMRTVTDNRQKLEDMIRERIKEYDCVKNGKINWASSSLGGKVIRVTGAGPSFEPSSFLGLPCLKNPSGPSTIISKTSEKSDCWTFKGEGTVLLQLATPIYISHFTIDHFPKDIMIPNKDLMSAPKLIIFKGYRHKNDASPHTFGAFEYKFTGGASQTFAVKTPSNSQFEIIEFQFKSNYGNQDCTCVHKIQVHGRLTSDPASPLNPHAKT